MLVMRCNRLCVARYSDAPSNSENLATPHLLQRITSMQRTKISKLIFAPETKPIEYDEVAPLDTSRTRGEIVIRSARIR